MAKEAPRRYNLRGQKRVIEEIIESESESSEDVETASDKAFIVPDEILEVENRADKESEGESLDRDVDWAPDVVLLSSELTESISDLLKPKMEQRSIEKLSAKLLEIGIERLREYTDPVPKDQEWKKGLSQAQVEELEPSLKFIRNQIKEKQVSLPKILAANLSIEERTALVEKYDIYKNIEDAYSEEAIKLRNEIHRRIEAGKGKDVARRVYLENMEKELLDERTDEKRSVKEKILLLNASKENKKRLLEMYESIKDDYFAEHNKPARDKIEFGIKLPYYRTSAKIPSKDSSPEERMRFCKLVRQKLDAEFYGMTEVKDRLIAALNSRINNPRSVFSIALKGDPGVGKTAILSAFAAAVGLPFRKISLGGLHDSTPLKGASAHWVGSSASAILKFLSESASDGMLLFDELCKLARTKQAKEVQDALLHIIDAKQNTKFEDLYMDEYPHDISRMWFMFSMNNDKELDPALHDRLKIIEVPSYKKSDLINITKLHLFPRALEDSGFSAGDLKIDDEACEALLDLFASQTKTSGVRPIERAVFSLVSDISLIITSGEENQLGLQKFIRGVKLPYTIKSLVVKELVVRPKKEEIPDFYT